MGGGATRGWGWRGRVRRGREGAGGVGDGGVGVLGSEGEEAWSAELDKLNVEVAVAEAAVPSIVDSRSMHHYQQKILLASHFETDALRVPP